jgi:hypothetical protein
VDQDITTQSWWLSVPGNQKEDSNNPDQKGNEMRFADIEKGKEAE